MRQAPMWTVTPDEIERFESEHQRYHAKHEDQLGPMETCQEIKCVELKLGIAWLKRRLEEQPSLAA